MKYVPILLILILFASCAGLKPKSGVITYDITMDEAAKRNGMDRNVGTKATAQFNKKYLHLKKNTTTPANDFEIVDLKTGQSTQYITIFKEDYALPMQGELMPDLTTLKLTEETKTIMGLPCKKAVWVMNGQPAYVYFTEAIKPYYCPFVPQEFGFAMEYQLHYPYGSFTYTASETEFKKIDKNLVKPPENYKIVTPKEYQMALFKNKNQSFIGQPAKPFIVTDMNGVPVDLEALKGKFVLLNFWFTNCAPCVQEIPDLNSLKRKYRKKNIEFIAVTFDDEQTVRDFMVEHPFDFRMVTDSRNITINYDIRSYPTTLLVNEKGIIVDEHIGGSFNTLEELENIINKHIN